MPCQGHPVGVCVRTRRALSAWSSSAARWRLGRCGNLIKDSNSHWQCAIRCAQCRVQGVRGQGSKLPNSASQKHRRQWCRGSQIRQGALSGGRTLSKFCPPNVHLRACFSGPRKKWFSAIVPPGGTLVDSFSDVDRDPPDTGASGVEVSKLGMVPRLPKLGKYAIA